MRGWSFGVCTSEARQRCYILSIYIVVGEWGPTENADIGKHADKSNIISLR